jgi:DNA polymerase-3 subunit beta
MNIICDKNLLTERLSLVSRTVSTRTTLPILECILLTADESGLCLTANDLEMSIHTAPLPAQVQEPGSVALDAKLLTEIVRKMPGDTVHIQTDNNYLTECTSDRAKFKINGLPGDEFPVMPETEKREKNDPDDKTGQSVIKPTVLRDMIRQTIFSVAVDESKPILTGELFQCTDNTLILVAVDGFRISYRRTELEGENASISTVVPAKALHELSRVLPSESDEEVRFYVTDKRIVFELKSFTFISRLLEGNFIRYDQVFNEDFATIITSDRLSLLNGLERACLVSRDIKKSPVKLEIQENAVIITSNTELGQSYDEISCDIDGQNLEIAFNPRYLIDALKAVEDDRIVITFTTALSPCIIRGVETDTYKYLILPLRLRG